MQRLITTIAIVAMVTLFLIVGYVYYIPVSHDLKAGDIVVVPANGVGETDVADGVMAVVTHYQDLEEAMDVANNGN